MSATDAALVLAVGAILAAALGFGPASLFLAAAAVAVVALAWLDNRRTADSRRRNRRGRS